MDTSNWPVLGCGVGLRNEHYGVVTSDWPKVDFFEAISENFMDSGGRPLQILEKVRERYPVVLHGTSLSISSCDTFDQKYLFRLKELIQHIQPEMISDHLCWCGVDGENLHDLLPIPYTEEAVGHIVARVDELQNFLGRRIMLENVSTYITYEHSTMKEWEFIAEIARRSGCGILLDINNIYVNAFNHQFDPKEYLDHIPGEFVGQIHLAGHTHKGNFLFDTHNGKVIDPVWQLYQDALNRWGKISTLIEWDEDIPEFSVLLEEAEKARSYYNQAQSRTEIQQPVLAQQPGTDTISEQNGPTLLDVERWMKAKIQPIEKDVSTPFQEITLNPQGGDPGEERVSVYADGYLTRIKESLEEVYEAIKYMLGEGAFQQLAQQYAHTFPSHDYNLGLAGRNLPHLLEVWSRSQNLPFLPDLAKLEWLVATSFHAFDSDPLDANTLSTLTPEEWEKTRLVLQPSVFVLSSDWPVVDIWEARKQPIEDIRIPLENRPQKILVYRQNHTVYCQLLEDVQFEVLNGLSRSETVGQVCEGLVSEESTEMPPIAEWFSQWAQQGLFNSFEIVKENK